MKEQLLKEWQERLGLQDWCICLRYDCKPSDMANSDTCGECEFEETNKCAVIRIVSKEIYGERMIDFDFEKILVHELLHCKFCLLDTMEKNITLEYRVMHNLLEDMAQSLVMAKRRETKRSNNLSTKKVKKGCL